MFRWKLCLGPLLPNPKLLPSQKAPPAPSSSSRELFKTSPTGHLNCLLESSHVIFFLVSSLCLISGGQKGHLGMFCPINLVFCF